MIQNLIVIAIVTAAIAISLRAILKNNKGCNCPAKNNCKKEKCDIPDK